MKIDLHRTHTRRNQRGSAMVELAMGVTLLIFLLIGVIDYGPMFYNTMQLDDAARAGAIYGSQSVSHSADLTGMQNTALANIIDIQGVSATATQTCKCPGGTVDVDCSTSCAAGTIMIYANVSTQWTYTPTFQYPYVAYPLTFVRTARMRAQ
jgi:Flp pilus assembly protein TadG